jgi:hypothetical protein
MRQHQRKPVKVTTRTRRWRVRALDDDDDRDYDAIVLCGAATDNQETPAK